MRGSTPASHGLTEPKTFEDLFRRGRLSVVRDDYGKVEKYLEKSVDSTFDLIPSVVRHLIGAGGKRVRPIVHCLAARMCGYTGDDHVILGSVSEIIHSATLFHDDVVDEGNVRRGRPTANRVWGNQVPVLVGDFIFARAFTIMMDNGFYRIAGHLGRTVEDLVQGELLQLVQAGNPLLGREAYFEIIRCKTASLFSWCGRSAAMVADLSDDESESVARFGHHFGMAFQIADDVLDYIGSSSETGKGSRSDLAEGKVTLPLILAMESDASLAGRMQEILPDPDSSEADLEAVAARVEAGGAIPASIRIAEEHAGEALGAIETFPPSPYKDALSELCRFALNRIH